MAKQKYDMELLINVLQRDGATLIGEYEKLNRDTRIKFTCKCGVDVEDLKSFRRISENGGAFCKKCVKANHRLKFDSTISHKFDMKLLNNVIQRDEAKLIGEYKLLNRVSRIHFICKCGIPDNKSLNMCNRTGCLCKKCTVIKKQNKTKETNISKFGVTHSSLNPETIAKRTITRNINKEEKSRVRHISKKSVEYTNKWGCIYLITNVVNNKKYIGLHNNPDPIKRYKQHWTSAKRGTYYSLYIDMREFGELNFKIETVYIGPLHLLPRMEEYYAEQYETYTWDFPGGYNMVWCGDMPLVGRKLSDEHKRKFSNTGRKHSVETREKISLAHKGRKFSEERCKQMSIRGMGHKGRTFTDEQRKHLSDTRIIGKSGERYITCNKFQEYRVQIRKKEVMIFYKSCKTLEEAIKARDDFINANS